jgi:hypothetical protein
MEYTVPMPPIDRLERTYDIDIGENAANVGTFFIFARYILPLFLAVILALALGCFLVWFLGFMASHTTQFVVPTLPQAPQIRY